MSELVFSDSPDGFRLESMELYNWGTFGSTVWRLPFGGGNALVTGDIGSGKSTWVDALSTLLIPPQRLTYNKAAGAERRERTDRSYLLGEYRSSRDELAPSARPVYLRDEGCYSVIVAVFEDARSGELLSLAQLRWLKGGDIQRLYVCSGRRLSVMKDFGDFSGDGAAFKRRLRLSPSTEAFDSYADYALSLRSAMGMTDKAIDLFNQTVSMKTIGDLDDFIRCHMLEPTGADERVQELLKNFDTLRAAHDAVESYRLQRDALLPLSSEGKEHLDLVAQKESMETMIQALPYFCIARLVPLLEREQRRLEAELSTARSERERCQIALEERREDEARLRSAIDNSEAGRRITELEAELARCADERDRRKSHLARYREPLESLGHALPRDAASFSRLREALTKDLSTLESRRAGLADARDQRLLERREAEARLASLDEELASLRGRTNSIPALESGLRDELAGALGMDADELPFAGQFLRVNQSERAWEGCAERVLRRLALSVLVPEDRYKAACAWANDTTLGARLSFLRAESEPRKGPRLSPRALARVVDIHRDAPSRAFLEAELACEARHERCDGLEAFHREPDAVLASGLVKDARTTYDKNDEQTVADPRRFVLGWSNAEKIALLERDRLDAGRAQVDATTALAAADREIVASDRRRDAVLEALRFADWHELDLDAMTARYAALKDERDALERSSDQLTALKAALAKARSERAGLDAELALHNESIGGLEARSKARAAELAMHTDNLTACPESTEAFSLIDEYLRSIGLPAAPSLDTQGAWQGQIRQRMDSRVNTIARRDQDLRGSLIRRMHEFLSAFPERSSDLAAGIDFLPDFTALLSRIEQDDLPSYEGRFRALLRESTLQDIALFQSELENDADAIRRAIDTINKPLSSIEYNSGTYICLSAERREDQDVRDFRADLRRCLENTMGDDNLYSEEKFARVKALLSRLAGETAADRAWTERVTDARSWFTFTASERWKEDDTEKEFYSSSSGKSGGQKEKLAYTILASALTYQYRQGARSDRGGFRLVVIDEAFGRGSEESTRYGLRLFSSLGLQLVLVTPLQKISVIEGSVDTIHFIANPSGSSSELRTIGILEYREEKASRAEAKREGLRNP